MQSLPIITNVVSANRAHGEVYSYVDVYEEMLFIINIFKIINFPNMCSNIPASLTYGVYISQLIRYARAAVTITVFKYRNKIGKIVVKAVSYSVT
jgi:hypothetical protein